MLPEPKKQDVITPGLWSNNYLHQLDRDLEFAKLFPTTLPNPHWTAKYTHPFRVASYRISRAWAALTGKDED